MNSNRDYATENINLKKRLEVLEKEKQATIKLMGLMALDNDIVESALILDKYQQENEKLKEEKLYYQNKYLELNNSYQMCEDLKRKKAIEIIKEHPMCIVDVLRFNNYFTYREMYDGLVELTKRDFDLLKEVLGE